MIPKPAAAAALDALAAAIGVPLQFDENGQCGLAFDGDVELVMASAAEDDTLRIHGRVASVGPTPSTEVLRLALALNDGRLPPCTALALEPRSGQLTLMARPAQAEPGAVVMLVADLVALVPAVRAELGLPNGLIERVHS